MKGTLSDVIAQFKAALQQLYGERLSQVILFGSYARGDEHTNSDVDFLVVLNDKKISVSNEIRKINDCVYDIILRYGKIISFIPTSKEKFENSPNHFYRLIKQEGITV